MACWLSLRYLVSLLLHLNSHEIYPRDFKEFAGARIFFQVDKDKHYWVWGVMILIVEWPVRLAAGGVAQAIDKATFVIGDYDDDENENGDEDEDELGEKIEGATIVW